MSSREAPPRVEGWVWGGSGQGDIIIGIIMGKLYLYIAFCSLYNCAHFGKCTSPNIHAWIDHSIYTGNSIGMFDIVISAHSIKRNGFKRISSVH